MGAVVGQEDGNVFVRSMIDLVMIALPQRVVDDASWISRSSVK
jgi:hypothetical protein